MDELEMTCKRMLQTHKGVIGVIAASMEGAALYSTLNEEETDHFLLFALSVVNASTKGFDKLKESTNKAKGDLSFLRIRTSQQEIHIVPEKSYLLIAIQDLDASDSAT